MPAPIDLIGKKFGRLTVIGIGQPGKNTYGKPIKKWISSCECGGSALVTTSKLKSGHTQSCGCLHKEITSKTFKTHGQRKTRAYDAWAGMKDRCLNKNHKKFHLWGGRGISICSRWINSFENFLTDMGHPPEGKSLDRINNNGHYDPSNCRWATPKEQASNRGHGIIDPLPAGSFQ